MKSKYNIARHLPLASVLALGLSAASSAAIYQWTGTTDGNLSGTTTDYSPNGTPGSGDTVEFNAASYTNAPSANAAMNLGELWFAAGDTAGVTFGAGTGVLTLSGVSGTGIQIDSGSGAVNTGGTTFALAGSQSWTNNSANTLTVGGTITNTANTNPYTLTLGGTGNTTLGGAISNGGTTGTIALTKSGGGTLLLSGTNTYTGATTISAGTLAVSGTLAATAISDTGTLLLENANAAVSSAVTLNNNSTLALRADANTTFNVASFAAGGATTINLSADHVSSGTNNTLSLNDGFSTTPSVSQTINYTGGNGYTLYLPQLDMRSSGGGILTLNSNSGTLSIGDLYGSYTGGTVDLVTLTGAGNMTLTLGHGNNAVSSDMVFNQTGTVTISGSQGTAGNANGYYTQFNSGTVVLKSTTVPTAWDINSIGGANTPVIDNQSGGTITFSRNVAATWAGNFTFGSASTTGALNLGTGAVTLTGTRAVTVANTTYALTAAGAIGGSGYGLIKVGPGALILSASSSYTGGTTVAAGSIFMSNTATLASGGNMSIANGAYWYPNGTSQTLGQLTGQGTVGETYAHAGTDTLTVGSGNVSSEFDGVIAGGNGSSYQAIALTKTGSGTLTLTGANSYTGLTTINGGTLNINSEWALGGSVYGGLTFGSSGGTLQYASTLSNIYTDITQTSSGTARNVTLTGNATIDTNGNDITFADAFGNSGAGSMTKVGSGTLTLGGANTYTGATSIANGTLSINSVATGASAQSLGAGGTLNLGVAHTSSGILQYTGGGGTLDKAVNVLGNGLDTIQNAGVGLLALSGTVTNNGTTVTLGGSGAITVSGTITGSGAGASNLIDADTSLLTLANADSYDGSTTVDASSVLEITNGGALGGNGATVISGGALELSGGITVGSVEALTLSGTGIGNGGALRNVSGVNTYGGTITLAADSRINSDADSLTLTGGIGGAHNLTIGGAGNTMESGAISTSTLTKDGAGTLTLSGTNTYAGATTVNAGTLEVTGSTAAGSAVTVNGGMLSGSGTIGGTVDVVVSGTIHPGNMSTLSTGVTTISGTYECDINSTSSDRLAVNGALTLSGATLSIHSLPTPAAASYTIATYGSLSGTFTGLAEGAPVTIGSATYIIHYAEGGNNITLSLPPASGYSSWIGGFAGLSDSTPGGNPSGDGIPNLMKYVLNGDPSVSDPSVLPSQTEDGNGNLVFTYPRLHESTNDTTQIFEYGSDLVNWTDVTIPASSGSSASALTTGTIIPAMSAPSVSVVITSHGSTDTVVVTLPTNGATVFFARLKVTQP